MAIHQHAGSAPCPTCTRRPGTMLPTAPVLLPRRRRSRRVRRLRLAMLFAVTLIPAACTAIEAHGFSG